MIDYPEIRTYLLRHWDGVPNLILCSVCSKPEEKVSDESTTAPSRQIPVIIPRRDPPVFEFGR